MIIARFSAKALFVFQTALALSAAVIYDGGGPNGETGQTCQAAWEQCSLR